MSLRKASSGCCHVLDSKERRNFSETVTNVLRGEILEAWESTSHESRPTYFRTRIPSTVDLSRLVSKMVHPESFVLQYLLRAEIRLYVYPTLINSKATLILPSKLNEMCELHKL